MDHSTTPATPVAGTSFRRVVATLVTAALAATGVLAVSAPASAEGTPQEFRQASLTWGVSPTVQGFGVVAEGNVDLVNPVNATSQYDGGTLSFVKSAGFTLTDGTGLIDDDGFGTLDFEGSVTYSPYANYGGLAYQNNLTLADFELEIDSADRGSLTADLTWVKEAGSLTEPTRVTVANFDIDSLALADGTLDLTTAAPDFTGAVAPDTYSAGYADSFPESFVDAMLTEDTAADFAVYFYRTGTTSGNTAKIPVALTATAEITPVVTLSGLASSYEDGVSVTASGVNFRAVTNPGDAGVYVAIAESGGITDYSSSAMGNFIGAQYVPTALLSAGTFTRTLVGETADFDRTKSYSVYTWQSHTHSNTTQDTETPIDIDFDTLRATPTVTLGLNATSTAYGKALTPAATIPGATGSVRFLVNGKSVKTGELVDGKAKVTLPSTFAAGTYELSAEYLGDSVLAGATSVTKNFTVTKATTSKVTVSGAAFTKGTAPKLTVKVATLNNGAYPVGSVKIYFGDRVVKTQAIYASSKGTVTVTLPKQSKAITVSASFIPSSANVEAKSSSVVTVKVK